MALTKISQAGAKDEAINEAKIQISNAGTNGQYLQKQSGNTGGLTWADVSTADATKMPLAGGTFTGDVIWDNQTNAGNDLTWDESEDQLEFKDGVKATFGDGGDLVIGHDFVNHVDKSLIYSTTDLDIGCNKVSFMDQLRNTRLTVDHNNAVIDIVDNAKLRFGTGNDLEIYHDGSHSYIRDNGTGDLRITADDLQILNSSNNEVMIKAVEDGAVELYHNAIKTVETHSNGVYIYGPEGGDSNIFLYSDEGDDVADRWKLTTSSSASEWTLSNVNNGSSWETNIKAVGDGAVELYYDNAKKFETVSTGCELPDDSKLYLGDSGDLALHHDGSNSWLTNTTGSLFIKSDTAIKFQDAGGNEDFLVINDNGAVELYYNNAKKFETISSGVQVTGALAIPDGASDGNRIAIGNHDDLLLYHDGTYNWIDSVNNHDLVLKAGTGDVYIQGSDIFIGDEGANEKYIDAHKDGAVELYYDNSKKFETHSGGCIFTGDLYGLDTAKIRLGNSNDFELYHDGSNSVIQHGTTGNMRYHAGNHDFYNQAGDEYQLRMLQDGAVTLYYNGNQKVQTTSTGVTVSSSGSAELTVKAANNSDAILNLNCDNEDNDGDHWRFVSQQANNKLAIQHKGSGSYADKFDIDSSGNISIGGGLTSSTTAKAWIVMNMSTGSSLDSFGVSSISDEGTGTFDINFSTALSNNNAAAFASVSDSALHAQIVDGDSDGNGFRYRCLDGGGSLTDDIHTSFIIFDN